MEAKRWGDQTISLDTMNPVLSLFSSPLLCKRVGFLPLLLKGLRRRLLCRPYDSFGVYNCSSCGGNQSHCAYEEK